MSRESGDHAGQAMYEMLRKLWPLHRTINSDDLEYALLMCGEFLGNRNYTIQRFKPGQEVLTWRIPERFKVKEAWLEVGGERIADFARNPLHVLSYSLPKSVRGTLGEIRDHIWTRADRPNAVPWEFKYYERSWGWCVRHADLMRFEADAPVRGIIDTEFTDGDLCLGDYYLPGESGEDILFLTNICHPCQVNDSIAGLVVAIEMARELETMPRRHGFRLLIVPETIGTIAWIATHASEAARVRYAWFAEMLGHDKPFILQLSRQGNTYIDRVFQLALRGHRRHGEEKTGEFRKVVASDEIVTNGPGYDIPTPSLTRGKFPEYHTSDDNPSIIKPENLAEGLDVFRDIWDILNTDYYPQRTFVGPVMLSRYGLWVDWRENMELNLKTESIMLKLEGHQSVADIAWECELPMKTVRAYLDRFHEVGLIKKSVTAWPESAPSGFFLSSRGE